MKKRLVGTILTSLLVVLLGVNTLMLPIAHAIPKKKPTIKQDPQLMVAMPVKKPFQPTMFETLLPLAEAGNITAQFGLGYLYHEGNGVPLDQQKALYWWTKSAEQGDESSKIALNLLYDNGQVSSKAEQSHPEEDASEMDSSLKTMFDEDENSLKDIQNFNAKDARHQHNLALAYMKGRGVEQDYSKAFYWFHKASEQGLSRSQYNLAYLYRQGTGIAKDYTKAVYWYQKAAEQGLANAQYNLGVMNYDGIGTVRNYSKAFYWFNKAALQGDKEAQNNLGFMYAKGLGVVQNHQQAFYWYQKAVDHGNLHSQFNLALRYDLGKGVMKNKQQAFYWYQKASANGIAEAQNNLGVLYANGEGVTRNAQQAYVWLSLASNQGSKMATENKKMILKRLTPAQLTQAQQWARGWHEKIQAKKAQTPE